MVVVVVVLAVVVVGGGGGGSSGRGGGSGGGCLLTCLTHPGSRLMCLQLLSKSNVKVYILSHVKTISCVGVFRELARKVALQQCIFSHVQLARPRVYSGRFAEIIVFDCQTQVV